MPERFRCEQRGKDAIVFSRVSPVFEFHEELLACVYDTKYGEKTESFETYLPFIRGPRTVQFYAIHVPQGKTVYLSIV